MGFCEGRVSDQAFGPLQRLLFARMVGGHIPVGSFDVLRHDMGTREFFNELADATPADGPVKALIDGLADSDCEFSTRGVTLYVLYTYRAGVSSGGVREARASK
jgi:hypothetical protein